MKKLARSAGFWIATVTMWELVLHLVVWRSVSVRFLFAAPFIVSLGLFFTFLSRICRRERVNRGIGYALICVFAFLFSVQTVYYKIFGSLLTVTLVGMGGDAIVNFFDVAVDGTVRSLPFILLYFLPAAVMAGLYRKKILFSDPADTNEALLLACVSILAFAAGVPEQGSGSARSDVYYEINTSVDKQTEYFGLVTAERLELGRVLTHETGLVTDVIDITTDVNKATEGTESGTAPDVEPAPPAMNIMDEMDFATLLDRADTKELRELSRYFSSLGGTKKNDFTGLFEGFNVIEICAESYWPYFIDPELTPVLYKLTNEGIVFENFYGSFPNTTTNGEFSFCMGLMPDKNRRSFTLSINDYLPFTMAHMMKPLGVTPRAYHNNTAYFYGRINTHTNMGYEFKAVDYGLELSSQWPQSDLEMMEKTVDDYIGDERFLAYYMTVSGHAPYDFDANTLAAKNREKVGALEGTEAVRAYVAGQLELEYALEYLLDRLEEAGKLETTLIVLTGDHFPYALSTEELASLAGEKVFEDPFWQYKNSFICWSGAIKEPIHVDDFCCTQDILPTVLNLLGLEYDSRLLTGTDVFSDSTHIAVLFDGSFRTKDLIYDADRGTVTYLTAKEELPEGYFEKLKMAVNNQFSVSASILRNDYYGFAYRTLGLSDTDSDSSGKYTLSDIEGKWYADEAETLVREGVITGNSATFRGEETASRAEFATMLAKAFNLSEPDNMAGVPFTDIAPGQWEFDMFVRLWNAGLIAEDTELVRPLEPADQAFAEEITGGFASYFGLPEGDTRFTAVLKGVLDEFEQSGGDPAKLTRGACASLAVRFRDAAAE